MKKSDKPTLPTIERIVEKIGQNKKNACPQSTRQNKQKKRKK
jgi:hypothetical protein